MNLHKYNPFLIARREGDGIVFFNKGNWVLSPGDAHWFERLELAQASIRRNEITDPMIVNLNKAKDLVISLRPDSYNNLLYQHTDARPCYVCRKPTTYIAPEAGQCSPFTIKRYCGCIGAVVCVDRVYGYEKEQEQ